MALFSRNNTKETDAKKADDLNVSSLAGTIADSVILKPRVTEKAVGQSEKGVYVFVVRRDATKYQIADAVRELYNVTPVKVNIVNKLPRTRRSGATGRTISSKGMKKAYVYLKKGDVITLV